jgi:hypothetical protein
MLIEIWEWQRGYSKWTPVEARVEFVKDEHIYHDKEGKDLHYSHVTGELLVWTDAGGQRRQAPLKPPGDDPKYQFTDGEAAAIRYNPANPEQYYFRKLSEMKVLRFFRVTFTVIGVAIFSIGSVWIREMLGCSR